MNKKICSVCRTKFEEYKNQKFCSKECYNLSIREKKQLYNRSHKQEAKEWRKEHKEELIEKKKEWYLKNKDKILKRTKIYREIHKEEISKKAKKYQKRHHDNLLKKAKKRRIIRRKFDINFRILCNLRTRLWWALKNNSKYYKTKELIGCSIDKLKKHLEKQFTKEMSWNNYGLWEIDHIRPCASFDLSKESEQKKCFHYTNLQPLWAKENRQKQGKI
jgi:hypothetical protein